MRRTIFYLVLVLCLVLTDKAQAQRALPGMRGIELRGGMVDGFLSQKDKLGYSFGVAMATYTKNANKWVFGAEFLNKYYPYKDIRVPIAQFTGEGGYYFKFLADGSKTFFFSLGGSAMAGYETVNWGDKLLFDGSRLRHKDAFLYGGAITLEIEAYLTDKLVLLLTGRERILWGTSTGHFHMQIGLGIKFILN